MSMLKPLRDPASVLTPPEVSEESLEKMTESRAGSIFGTLDTVAQQLFGFSPLDRWVFKNFIGDWERIDKASTAWANTAESLDIAGLNAEHLTQMVGNNWEGAGYDSFSSSQARFAELLPPLAQQCQNAAELNSEFVKYARLVAEFILAALDTLATKLVKIAIQLAVPGPSQIVGAFDAAGLVSQVFTWGARILELTENVLAICQAYQAIITGIQDSLADAIKLVSDWGKAVKGAGNVLDTFTSLAGALKP